GGGSSPPQITVSVTGPSSTRLLATAQFSATVTNSLNQSVIWQVNGVTGGNSANGTISLSGLYTAPATMPSSMSATISAISQASSTASASASDNLLNPIPIVSSAVATESGT